MNKVLRSLAVLALTLALASGCKKPVVQPEPPPPPPPPPVVEEPPPPPPPPPPAPVFDEGVLVPIYFDYDKADLMPDAINALGRIANSLREFQSVRLMAEGNADERGTSAYNMGLGETRARAVRDYLVSYGVEAGRIDVTSYGKERPANPNCGGDDACHSKNRRVEWRLVAR